MNVHGAFLVCGGTDAPALHFLSPAEQTAYWQRYALAWTVNGRRQVLRHTFGVDALYALPAWTPECMVNMATKYQGDDAETVRGMCAALALGRTLTREQPAAPVAAPAPARSASSGGGGRTVKSPRPAPAPAGSGGGFFGGLA